MRAKSEREVRNYDCPRLGRPVVFSYLFKEGHEGETVPRGVHCARAVECGVERKGQGGHSEFDWTSCPLWPELVEKGFLPR